VAVDLQIAARNLWATEKMQLPSTCCVRDASIPCGQPSTFTVNHVAVKPNMRRKNDNPKEREKDADKT